MPSPFRPEAMACRPAPSTYSEKIRCTTGAAIGSGASRSQPLADRGLGGVRVRAGVDELVAVRRPAAEEAALDRRLGGHRRADPGLDAHSLALAHPAVQRHHQVVCLGAWVDGAADLGHPQLDAVVREHREREPELVAVERALRLTDDDGVEATRGVGKRVEEHRGCTGTRENARPTRRERQHG